MSTVLVIPDTQEPFGHRDAITFLKWCRDKYRPSHIVHVGDEVDFHALGDWDHDPDGYSPGHELEAALKRMALYYQAFPKVMACRSNHTDRPLRKAFKAGIPSAFMRDYKEFLQAPKGWEWDDKHEIDGIVYEHGEGMSGYMGALNAALRNGASTVIGHIHSHAGIQFSANEKQLIYGFNVGCLIDRHKYAFRYGKHFRHKPILGVGLVRDGVPTFVPMTLDSQERWKRSA